MNVGATYRLQFHQGFGFDDAAAIAPYLARLGVSHVYASPYLMARRGSTHGYDIIDHNQLNPELGGDEAFARMCAAFDRHGLRQILDFVPNHMGVGGSRNPFWLDVLAWGADSEYAGWFDIDWNPNQDYLKGKLLVPFLGDQYGAELEAGRLVLKFDEASGSFAVWAYDTHALPICPLHYARIISAAHPDLEQLGDAFTFATEWRPQIARRAARLQAELAELVRDNLEIRAAIHAAVSHLNGRPGEPESWAELDALIQDQHWRVAHFRVAGDDINYRRFFNINELAGLRIELPDLFDHAHRLVFRLLRDGVIDGLRIDHVDGLFDPKQYVERLRRKALDGASEQRPFYLVVEKILSHHESLRDDWAIEGTTGYEYLNLLTGVLVDPAAEEAFTQVYAEFAGAKEPFHEVVRNCKIRIMQTEMASELTVLARDAARVARQNRRTADFTQNILERALREIIACFPVYRTYLTLEGDFGEADQRDLSWAMAQARRHRPDLDKSVFDFCEAMLSGSLVAEPKSGFSRYAVLRCAMKFQQLSGPVMAKGLEDTAFYRFNRFVALNEVGGHPDRFGTTLAAFHRANQVRAENWPQAMLSSSTHDTKRGEDTRARLVALSELPEEWQRQVQAWSRILRARRGDVEGHAPPDRNDEYLFYQLLLGAWPVELLSGPIDQDAIDTLRERLKGAMTKSVREAKLHSSWTAPDAAYEEALLGFVDDALDTERSGAFLDQFRPFAEKVAALGAVNTLVQTVLKLTSPGVPDLYQGTDLWDLSLVDPDNRRPVDYGQRRTFLEEIAPALDRDRAGTMRALFADWKDARFKLATVQTLLDDRRRRPGLYAEGSYEGLAAKGADAERVCAFVRRHEQELLVVVAARFPGRGTSVDATLPEIAGQGRVRDLLTGRELSLDSLRLDEVLADLPVAVLVNID
ncbi:malto-oligosyltrehalose synthase [Geminicoccus roseus]|uniref:malto-oligosyltrehalose synthase n=1 Tax=Geminicoccus roseus TaxID=404900 RepID=UPI0004083E05|nr:malto-oligosyltrehalose synthase [Geminicoccus roseus]